MRTVNRKLMRQINVGLVLQLIRESPGVSQINLVNQTQLSSGAVTSIVKELKERQLVREVGRESTAIGRKPTLLTINPDVGYVISGVFLADESQVAVLDSVGAILGQKSFATGREHGPRDVFERFSEHAKELLTDLKIHRNRVLGAAVGCEGIVEHRTGTLILSSRFGWRNVPVKTLLEDCLGMTTYVDSEGATMAMGECHFGVGKGSHDIVCVDIDAGIGAVIVHDGQLQRGANQMAGEIGHGRALDDGTVCECGKTGCLETVASGAAMVRRVRGALKAGRKASISTDVHTAGVTPAIRAIFSAAHNGDELALSVAREAGRYLGLAVASIINFADPDLVILTGCVIHESAGLITDAIRKAAQAEVLDSRFRTIRIEEAALGGNASLIGAATMVYDRVFPGGARV